jgi:hypothetical protein
VNHQTGFEHDRVRNHRIVRGIRVFGDVEIFLYDATQVRKKRPVRTNSRAKFPGREQVVSANRNQPAIADLKLALKLHQTFMLPPLFGTITAAAEH